MAKNDDDGNIIALKCRKKDTLGFFCVPVSRLRTGQDHYARLDDPFPEIAPEDIWKTFKHIEITVPPNAHNMDFVLEKLVNYITFTALPMECRCRRLPFFSLCGVSIYTQYINYNVPAYT